MAALLSVGLHASMDAQEATAPLARGPWLIPAVTSGDTPQPGDGSPDSDSSWVSGPFRTLSDSIQWVRTRDLAAEATGHRLVISLLDRQIWWINGADTLYTAPVAVGKGTLLEYQEWMWNFATPRGIRAVIGKEQDPVWIPPFWHYVEAARKTDRELVKLERGQDVELYDGSRLVIRGDQVGQLLENGVFLPVPPGEEIVFDNTIFVPPFDTVNRRITGELGDYKLDMGEGYLLHGTPHKRSIGTASTHGCIRLHDDDLEYLYESVPVGTRVYIY